MSLSVVPRHENLVQKASRWKRALADAATGPLIIAGEIVELCNNWDAYKEEADGLSASAWLRQVCGAGRGQAWFYSRHRAVERLGEACRRTMHHEVAVWITNHVTDCHLDEVKLMLMRECKANGGNPLTTPQAIRRIRKITGKSEPRRRECDRCQLLEKILADHGIDVNG